MISKVRIFALTLVVFSLAVLPGRAFAADAEPDDATVIGGDYTLESGEEINNLTVLGGNVTIEEGAIVQDHVTQLGGNLVIEGEVREDIHMYGGSMSLEDTALIGGDIRVVDGSFDASDEARVEGQVFEGFDLPFSIQFPEIPGVHGPIVMPHRDSVSRKVFDFVGTAVGLSVLAMLAVSGAPAAVSRAGSAAVARPVEAGGIGLIVAVLTPVLLIGFAVTLIGIPVTIALALLAGFLLACGWIALGVEAGRRLAESADQEWSPIVQAGVGTFVLVVAANAVGLTPCVGWIAPVLVGFIGMGGVLLSYFGTRSYPPSSPIVPA